MADIRCLHGRGRRHGFEPRAGVGGRARRDPGRRGRGVQALRRRARARGRDALRAARRDHVDHRPERRRQDHAGQHHQRFLPAQQRRDRAGGQGHQRRTAVAGRRHGGGAHGPEPRPVHRHDRARQHPAGTSRAHEVGRPRVLRLLGPGAEGGDRPPRPGRGPDRLSQAAEPAPPADRRARLRPAQARRAGAGAGARPENRPARRAHGRHEPGREGRHGALHPRREPGMGHHGGPDRARHGRGDGHFRPGRGARPRPQDRRGNAGRDAAPSGRDPRLSRHQQESSGSDRMTDTTLPRLLRRNAETMAQRPAIREKDRGIWQTFTWSEYYDQVRLLALGLAAHGFGRGDKLSVIGDNRPRLYWAQLAAQSLGGVSAPVFQDSIASEIVYVLNHADVSVIVAEDQEQVDKILSLGDQLPSLKLLIYDDRRGMRHYNSPLLKSFEEIQAAGREFGAHRAGYVEAEIDKSAPADIALLAYTSGTTGKPKGVMLSHANMISAAQAFVAAEDIRASDQWLCYLPMAWVGDALYSTTLSLRVGLAVGEFLVYGPVRDQLGLGRARWAYSGGGPLGADAYRFFRSFRINLKQIYGATELSGLASLQADGEADPDTVGRVCPGMQVRIAGNGEVQIRSAGLFGGYYKLPEATEEARTADGWYRTGDAGFLDPRGHLVIIDRAKDVGKLSDGTPFAPQFIENKLKFSPFIREAVAFGDARPFVAALIAIDLSIVGSWAEGRNLAYTSFQDLSAKPEVRRLIGEEIRRCNATLPAAAAIRRFLLLNKELDADDNEITRTRKIRRPFVAEKYAALIETLYGRQRDVEVTTDITYEDGRTGKLKSRVTIEDVEPPAAPAPAASEPAYA